MNHVASWEQQVEEERCTQYVEGGVTALVTHLDQEQYWNTDHRLVAMLQFLADYVFLEWIKRTKC